jgi:hypothetical protein
MFALTPDDAPQFSKSQFVTLNRGIGNNVSLRQTQASFSVADAIEGRKKLNKLCAIFVNKFSNYPNKYNNYKIYN